MTGVTPSFVILPIDTSNAGKNIDNVQLVNELGAIVQRQGAFIGDPAVAANRMTVGAGGQASVALSPVPASQFLKNTINQAAATQVALAPAIAGKSVKLYRLMLIVSAPTVLTVQDGATALTGPISCNATGGLVLDNSGDPWFESSIGNALNILSSNQVQLSGIAYYAAF